MLVVAQVTIAVVLVTSAGLVIKSLSRVMSLNPGFQTENVLTANIQLPGGRIPVGAVAPFFDRLLGSVSAYSA